MSGLRCKCFQGVLNMMSSVLVSLKDNLLLCNHWTKSFNSWLIADSIVPSFLAGHERLVSSVILNRHFADHLYKEEKTKDLMLNLV